MRALAAIVFLVPTIAQAADPLMTELQHPGRTWSQQELALRLFQTCRASDAQAPKQEIAAWAKLLKVDRALKSVMLPVFWTGDQVKIRSHRGG
jgi:hypothetical protein